jgi:hypothetical protein
MVYYTDEYEKSEVLFSKTIEEIKPRRNGILSFSVILRI